MCLSRLRGRLSTFIIILLWYAVPKSSGCNRSRGSTAASFGTTHTRFAHKYIILCILCLPVSDYFILRTCFLFFRGHLPTPRGYSSAMSRRTRRGLNFSLLLFIFLLFMNGRCPEDDLIITTYIIIIQRRLVEGVVVEPRPVCK